MDTDLLIQFFQYLLGVLPGDIAGNIIAIATTIVTICTLIIRFWKEPSQDSKIYKIWKIIHALASFKKPDMQQKGKENANKTL